jgi:tRNA(fMet)-specific endonuclease VapC
MTVLLDTDMVSELHRNRNAVVRLRASDHRAKHGAPAISCMTVFEIVFGWQRVKRPERAAEFLAWLSAMDVLRLDEPTCRLAGDIGGALARTGQPIGVTDVCIAATAIHCGHVLVSGNTDHFERVRAAGFPLRLDNWRNPAPP